MARTPSVWVARLLVIVGVGCFGCWFVAGETYNAGADYEEATFVMGWPTVWYAAEVRIDAGIIALQPEFLIQKRPYPQLGPTGVWRTGSGSLEKFPSDLQGGTGWGSAVCRRRSATNLHYGPLVPTLIGLGCFYVAWRLFSDAGRRFDKVTQADASSAEV